MNIVVSGSVSRKFFAYLLQSAIRAKDKIEKGGILDLEVLPSVPDLRIIEITKESDDNLHRSICTDFIACGSCNRSTDGLC